VAFLVGVVVGLVLSSFWRVVKRAEYDRWRRNGSS